MRVKMSKQPPPAPTASAVGPCHTVIQIVGRLGTGSLPSTIAPPDHPLQFTRNVSFPEARKIVESPTPVPGSSYASVIKPTTKDVSFTDATTQTDPVTILESEESNEIQMSASNNVTKTTTTQTKTPTERTDENDTTS